MKGIILAGGTGTRLFPLTHAVNKHLLPIGDAPMILYPIRKLAEAGVCDILVVTGPEHLTQFAHLLGDGSAWGVRVHFRVQSHAGGIAQALALAESFVGTDQFLLLLGDNLFADALTPVVAQLPLRSGEALVVLKEVSDPERFGIAHLEGGRVVDVVEKPQQWIGNQCVTGIYAYTHEVFAMVRDMAPSARGELEISEINRGYAMRGCLKHHLLSGWWIDAGTMEAFHEANRVVRQERP